MRLCDCVCDCVRDTVCVVLADVDLPRSREDWEKLVNQRCYTKKKLQGTLKRTYGVTMKASAKKKELVDRLLLEVPGHPPGHDRVEQSKLEQLVELPVEVHSPRDVLPSGLSTAVGTILERLQPGGGHLFGSLVLACVQDDRDNAEHVVDALLNRDDGRTSDVDIKLVSQDLVNALFTPLRNHFGSSGGSVASGDPGFAMLLESEVSRVLPELAAEEGSWCEIGILPKPDHCDASGVAYATWQAPAADDDREPSALRVKVEFVDGGQLCHPMSNLHGTVCDCVTA